MVFRSLILLVCLLSVAFARLNQGLALLSRDDSDDNNNGGSNQTAASGTSGGASSSSNQTSGLTGDSTCGTYMCVAATVNGSSTTYVLSSLGQATLGWMAVGYGTQMAGTEMVILWNNSDGSITLSQRKATGESLPPVDPNPSRIATKIPNLTSTSGNIQFAFSIPSNGDTNEQIIFAYGNINPDSSDPGATLQIHIENLGAALDLTKPLSPGSTSPTPGSGESATTVPLTNSQKLIVAHGIICVIGFLGFLPAGALLARYLRTFSNKWYTGHWIIQLGFGGPIIITGVALGIQSVNSLGAQHLDDDHKKWGIGIFVLYFVQCALGAVIHFFKPKSFAGCRPPQNYLHAILGLVIVAFALKQVGNGITEEWPASTGRPVEQPARIIWIVWCVVLPVLYFAGLALLPRQFKQEKASRVARDKSYHDVQ